MPDQASREVLDCAAVRGNKVQIDFHSGDSEVTTIKREGGKYVTSDGYTFAEADVKKARNKGVGFCP